jgi:hypothetical protein
VQPIKDTRGRREIREMNSASRFFSKRTRAGTVRERWCDGTSQVIRPTYSCPCPTDIRHPVDVPKSLDKFGIFPYLTRNVSPVLQTLQNIGDIEVRKQLHKLSFPDSFKTKDPIWRTKSSRIFTPVFLHLIPPWSKSNKNLSLPHLKTTKG